MKLALWQTAGFSMDVAANLRALELTAQAAASFGAALVLCPECWLCGYNIGPAVGDLAEPRDGHSAECIAALAHRHRIAIAYGYAERDVGSGHVYNAVQVFDPQGRRLAHYRKTHLFGPGERASFTAGDCFEPPFELEGIRFGLLVCYDVEYPEAVRVLTLLGVDAVLVPTALTDEAAGVPELIVPARAAENQIFVAYCNHAGVENGMRFLGGSRLVGVDGQTIAAAGAGEALLIGEIIREGRSAAMGHHCYRTDRRPELYALLTSNMGAAGVGAKVSTRGLDNDVDKPVDK